MQEAQLGDIILSKSKEKGNNAVDRIAVVLKQDQEYYDSLGLSDPNLFVMRVGPSQDQPIVIEFWNDFKAYAQQNYHESWVRHLHMERDVNFFKNSFYFIRKIIERPMIEMT